MSRNIKEIGKELMGKSLNSFHRKTGLTQLEKNNEMQDGILDGILSQVDDAYIEKTEQSNVIHLDGSGDGVVVVDSIEGNTMVNLATMDNWREGKSSDTHRKVTITSPTSWKKVYKFFHLKPNTTYTIFIKITNNSDATTGKMYIRYVHNQNANTTGGAIGDGQTGVFNKKITLDNTGLLCLTCESGAMTGDVIFEDLLLLEGDWTNKEMPTYFEGLQSSFEEKVNSEGKYEIEILSKNKNIVNIKDAFTCVIGNWSTSTLNNHNPTSGTVNIGDNTLTVSGNTSYHYLAFPVDLKKGVTYYLNYNCNQPLGSAISFFTDLNTTRIETKNAGNGTFVLKQDCKYIGFPLNNNIGSYTLSNLYININENYGYIEPKQNKIKLLINEPLRAVDNTKDRLCIKDNKLVVERNVFGKVFDGTEDLRLSKITDSTINVSYRISATLTENSLTLHMCDRLPNVTHSQWDKPTIGTHCKTTNIYFNIPLNWLGGNTLIDVKQYLVNQYNQGTPMKIVHILNEPIYEEVLNEYGEPVILEGYENGTIYIDSAIVPTTSVRYTPKMESFKTLKEVENNNIMLTNDVNDNIIPYMMDVDLMIMEKEMALMSHKNIRTIGVKDMTSMQKRTQDMLTRLIKGKTLTEQECKTRVVTYLDAGKITDAQAEELMLLISEVYA